MQRAYREYLNEDNVPVPKNVDQAKLMALISLNWLATHAPEELKPISVDNAVVALHKDFLKRFQSGLPEVPLDQKQINAFKHVIYGLFASRLGHPKISLLTKSDLNATTVAKEALQPGQSLGGAQGD